MIHFRASRAIRSLALAWFAAFVLVGSLAPLSRAGDFQLVCSSGSGPVLAIPDTPLGKAIELHALDCALGLPLCAPPLAMPELGVTEAS